VGDKLITREKKRKNYHFTISRCKRNYEMHTFWLGKLKGRDHLEDPGVEVKKVTTFMKTPHWLD
jgi:hypothetical protein